MDGSNYDDADEKEAHTLCFQRIKGLRAVLVVGLFLSSL